MNNVAIIGSPASGKTELAKGYVDHLQKNGRLASVIDINDDVLAPLMIRNIARRAVGVLMRDRED